MTYVTQQQLQDRYGEQQLILLTDRSGAGAVDGATVAEAIAAAAALIDAHLGERYTLPLTAVPELLRGLAQDLVYARLHVDRAPEQVLAADREARRVLRDLRDGTLSLPLPTGGTPMAVGTVHVGTGSTAVADAITAFLGRRP